MNGHSLFLATGNAPAVIAQAATDAGSVGVEWIIMGVLGALALVGLGAWVLKRAKSSEIPAAPPQDALPTSKGKPAPVQADKPTASPAERGATISKGLERTRKEGFIGRLGSLFRGKAVDDAVWGSMEEVLYTADMGVRTAERLLEGAKGHFKGREASGEEVLTYLRGETRSILDRSQQDTSPGIADGKRPYVIMVVGVNGTGKTTTIGKIANRLRGQGERVLLVAADTFRAAAVEQLAAWAERSEVDVSRGTEGADPASVAFDGVKKGVEDGYSVILVDTAGRLHTSQNLVKELEKVSRTIGKAHNTAPDEVWLVLDSTMGQNAIQQARIFTEAVQVSALVLTKLDGTAKGGVIIGICDEMKLPIRFIGVGEGMHDIRPFDAEEFVEGLFGPS